MDSLTDSGWQIPPDCSCQYCSFPYRYETSDAREYQRFCSGDCERDEEKRDGESVLGAS